MLILSPADRLAGWLQHDDPIPYSFRPDQINDAVMVQERSDYDGTRLRRYRGRNDNRHYGKPFDVVDRIGVNARNDLGSFHAGKSQDLHRRLACTPHDNPRHTLELSFQRTLDICHDLARLFDVAIESRIQSRVVDV